MNCSASTNVPDGLSFVVAHGAGPYACFEADFCSRMAESIYESMMGLCLDFPALFEGKLLSGLYLDFVCGHVPG